MTGSLRRRPPYALLALAWLTLPLTAGGAIPRLLDEARATTSGRAAAWTLASVVYGAGALAVFRPAGLVLLRTGAAAVLGWVVIPSLFFLPAGDAAGVLASGMLAAVLSWSGPVTQVSADAAAVPGERRFALAGTPGLTWILGPTSTFLVSGLGAGTVLAGAGCFQRARPLLAVPLGASAALASYFLGGALVRLGRRWLVVVPSGIVLYDPVLLEGTLRLSPDEVGAVALTRPGWRERLSAPDILDATGGVHRALWIGLTAPLLAPRTRPPRRQAGTPVRHIFCAPIERGEAALALAAKGYDVREALGAP